MGYQKKRLAMRVITTIVVGLFALLFIFPFLWMLSTSFKYEIDVMEFPVHLIPQRWNFQNYVTVFTKSDYHNGSLCICETSFPWKEVLICAVSVNDDGTWTGAPSSEVHLFPEPSYHKHASGPDHAWTLLRIWSTSDAPGIHADPV